MVTIYIHGFSGDKDGLAVFARAMQQEKYHLYSLPGFGGIPVSSSARDNFDVYLSVIYDELVALYPGEPFHLVGHSYGGMIAYALAATYPKQIRRLTLVSPVRSPNIMSRITSHTTAIAARYLPQPLVVRLLSNPLLVDSISRYMSRHESHEGRQKVKRMRRDETKYYNRDMLQLSRHVGQFRKKFACSYIDIPTMLVVAKYDNFASPDDSRWYISHCRSRVKVIENDGGHLRVVTDPEQIAAALHENNL